MSERALLVQRQPYCQGSREADQGEHDVAFGKIAAKRTILRRAVPDRLHERRCASAEVWPVLFFQEGMNDIHDPNAIIERHVHVLAEHVDAVGRGLEQGFSGANGFLQYVPQGRVKKRLLIREVPVEGSYADMSPLGHSISRRLTANFENQLDRNVDKLLSIFLRISPHGRKT